MTRFRALLAAAVLLGAAAAPVYVATGPAQAASACTASGGVTVVVDFHQLGGGVDEVCDPNGGGEDASTIFGEAGFVLHTGPDGGVCQVAGEPSACKPMASAAYWSLWSAGPKGGSWTYAQVGASELTVPNGGFVAFSWQGQAAKAPPGPPARHAAAPKPTPKPHPTTQAPAKAPTKGATAPHRTPSTATTGARPTSAPATASAAASPRAGGPSASPTPPSLSSSPRPNTRHTAVAGGGSSHPMPPSPSATPSGSVESDGSDGTSQGGFPAWIAPVAVVVLAGIAVIVGIVRRRHP